MQVQHEFVQRWSTRRAWLIVSSGSGESPTLRTSPAAVGFAAYSAECLSKTARVTQSSSPVGSRCNTCCHAKAMPRPSWSPRSRHNSRRQRSCRFDIRRSFSSTSPVAEYWPASVRRAFLATGGVKRNHARMRNVRCPTRCRVRGGTVVAFVSASYSRTGKFRFSSIRPLIRLWRSPADRRTSRPTPRAHCREPVRHQAGTVFDAQQSIVPDRAASSSGVAVDTCRYAWLVTIRPAPCA